MISAARPGARSGREGARDQGGARVVAEPQPGDLVGGLDDLVPEQLGGRHPCARRAVAALTHQRHLAADAKTLVARDVGAVDELAVAPSNLGLDVPEDVPLVRGEHDRLPILVIAEPVSTCVHEILALVLQMPRLVTKL